MRSGPPAAAGTGDSERQENASTAASEEAGQANLLGVARPNLTLNILIPHRVQISMAGVLRQLLMFSEKALSSPDVKVYGLNMRRKCWYA